MDFHQVLMWFPRLPLLSDPHDGLPQALFRIHWQHAVWITGWWHESGPTLHCWWLHQSGRQVWMHGLLLLSQIIIKRAPLTVKKQTYLWHVPQLPTNKTILPYVWLGKYMSIKKIKFEKDVFFIVLFVWHYSVQNLHEGTVDISVIVSLCRAVLSRCAKH